jgi:hypothetical protein
MFFVSGEFAVSRWAGKGNGALENFAIIVTQLFESTMAAASVG